MKSGRKTTLKFVCNTSSNVVPYEDNKGINVISKIETKKFNRFLEGFSEKADV